MPAQALRIFGKGNKPAVIPLVPRTAFYEDRRTAGDPSPSANALSPTVSSASFMAACVTASSTTRTRLGPAASNKLLDPYGP